MAPVAAACLALALAACGQKDPAALLASAKMFLAKGDRKAAVIEIKNAIQADPQSGEARYLLGSTLLDGGDPAQAEVELRKALRLGHPPDTVLPRLATDLIARGQPKPLIEEFGLTQLESASAKAALATSIASAHASLGNMGKAGDALKAALAADPSYMPALLSRAQMLVFEKDLPGALAIADGLIRSAPQNPEGWKLKGDIEQLGANDTTAAIASYRKALDARPDFVPARLSIVRLLLQTRRLADAEKELASLKTIAAGDPQVRYTAALVAFMNKDMKAAQDQSAQLLKAAPNNVQVLLLAASIEMETKSTALAQTHLSRALELMPENAAARKLLMVSLLRAGQPEQAVAALRRGRSDKPIDPSLYTVAGDAYLQSGDSKSAQSFFEKASQLDPTDAAKRTSLAIARLSGGDTSSGVLELQEVAASDKGTSADIALISAYLSTSKIDEALGAIDALEKKQPREPLAAYLRGRAMLSRQDAAGARRNFTRALELAPTYFPPVASLTAMDLAENKLLEAKTRLTQFISGNPANSQAVMALAEVNGRAGAPREEIVALIEKAISINASDQAPRMMLVDFYLRAGESKQAMAAAQSAVASLPDNGGALELLGRVQQQAGQFNQAMASFRKAADLRPGDIKPYLLLADAQLASKSPADATQSLLKALSLQSDLLDAQRALVSIYVDEGRIVEAIALAKAVQGQRPKESVGYVLEGDIHAYTHKASLAEAAYRTGLKQAPSTVLGVKLHKLLQGNGGAVEAERFASQWLKQSPRDVEFMFYLGDAAMLQKDLARAQMQYRKVIAIQPDSAAAWNNLAWLTNEQHQPGAMAMAEKANQLVPNQVAFMDTWATLLAESKRFDEAIKLQKRAVELQPHNGNLELGLAKLYIKAGDKEKARISLKGLATQKSGALFEAEASQLLQSL